MAIAIDPQIQTKRITADEFAALPEIENAAYVELIEGEVIVAGGAADIHQIRVGNMFLYFGKRLKTGELRIAPLSVRLNDQNVFEPDIFWISPDNTRCTLLDPRTWQGAPDFVVEILSPSTQRRDRDKKYNVYESSGVREYWLVEPVEDFIEVYHLINGKYERIVVAGLGEKFNSPTLGIEINVDALFKGE